MILRLSGEGDSGEPGASAGDLYVVIHLMEHKYFKRVDYDCLLYTSCNTVVEVHRHGYALDSKVIRPTMVSVAKEPKESEK